MTDESHIHKLWQSTGELLKRLHDEDVFLMGGIWCAAFFFEGLRRKKGEYFTSFALINDGDFWDGLAYLFQAVVDMSMPIMLVVFSIFSVRRADPEKRRSWAAAVIMTHIVLSAFTSRLLGLPFDGINAFLSAYIAPIGATGFLYWGWKKDQ